MKNKTILLGLNELNFDFIKFYADRGELPTFKSLFDKFSILKTESESEYKLLEPWIQWATVHTGKTYDEHKVFRLGDIVKRNDLNQIFEELESEGHSVGAVSPFNADNRLKKAAYFIPDPWTKTTTTGNSIIKKLSAAIQQTVNDNAQSKVGAKSIFSILYGFLRYVSPTRYFHYVKLFLNRKLPGTKAVILDSLLSDIHLSLWKKTKPDFSNLFLNSGAHIQHHYLFNSDAYDGDFKNPEWYCPEGHDPLIQILKEYDKTISKLLDQDVKLILATGLHQNPHKHLTFYWRLNNHVAFLKQVGITEFKEVLPRMSRDFLINFNSNSEAQEAQIKLESFKSLDSNTSIFEVDNRGDSLFIELVYSNNIKDDMVIKSESLDIEINNFKSFVSFVAIKNGEHNGIGYVLSNTEITTNEKIQLKELKGLIKSVVTG